MQSLIAAPLYRKSVGSGLTPPVFPAPSPFVPMPPVPPVRRRAAPPLLLCANSSSPLPLPLLFHAEPLCMPVLCPAHAICLLVRPLRLALDALMRCRMPIGQLPRSRRLLRWSAARMPAVPSSRLYSFFQNGLLGQRSGGLLQSPADMHPPLLLLRARLAHRKRLLFRLRCLIRLSGCLRPADGGGRRPAPLPAGIPVFCSSADDPADEVDVDCAAGQRPHQLLLKPPALCLNLQGHHKVQTILQTLYCMSKHLLMAHAHLPMHTAASLSLRRHSDSSFGLEVPGWENSCAHHFRCDMGPLSCR